jgi:deoxycytidine triphosphate deaminase
MVANDLIIKEWAKHYGVSPFVSENVNPASIDLRWSGKFQQAIPTPELWGGVKEAETLTIRQGEFYLLDTAEFITMPANYAGLLMLKSSPARGGFEALHAGWVEPDFFGTLTLEIINVHPYPFTITKGQRIFQLALFKMEALPDVSYWQTGRYNGQNTPQVAR